MKTISIFLVGFSLILNGCATQTFVMRADTNDEIEPKVDTKQWFFVAGIRQQRVLNAAEICGGADKVIKVETQVSFFDALLQGITYSVITPRSAKVYCEIKK